MTIKFDIIYHSPKKDDPPFTPYADICLKSSSTDSQGNIIISPELTSTEFEKYVDVLISDLRELKIKARKIFHLTQ